MARVHSRRTSAIECETNSSVPVLRKLSIQSRHLRWKAGIADRQRLVDHQDLGLDMGADREGQPRAHAHRVMLHRLVHVVADAGELGDRVELAQHLGALQARARRRRSSRSPGPTARGRRSSRAPATGAMRPVTRSSPWLGRVMPQITCSRVDLPQPLRPRKPMLSPRRTCEVDVAQHPERLEVGSSTSRTSPASASRCAGRRAGRPFPGAWLSTTMSDDVDDDIPIPVEEPVAEVEGEDRGEQRPGIDLPVRAVCRRSTMSRITST